MDLEKYLCFIFPSYYNRVSPARHTQKRKKKQERENIVKKCVVNSHFPKKENSVGKQQKKKEKYNKNCHHFDYTPTY